jgi:hypothetical protein
MFKRNHSRNDLLQSNPGFPWGEDKRGDRLLPPCADHSKLGLHSSTKETAMLEIYIYAWRVAPWIKNDPWSNM